MILAALAILGSLSAAVVVEAAPADPSRVAMVFPPWWDARRAIIAAGEVCDVSGAGGLRFIVNLHCRDRPSRRTLRAVGALFLLGGDPRSLCGSGSPGVAS